MYKRADSWYSDFWYNGRRYTKAWGIISKTVAKEKEQKFKTEVREGKHELRAKKILFENFAEKYLEAARVNKKPNTVKRNEVSIRMLGPDFDGKLIDKIHPFMVEQYKRTRRERGAKPATINRDVTTLKNILNKSVEWGFLRFNPIVKVKNLIEDNEVMWCLTREEEEILLQKCDKRPQREKYLKDLALFALNTGMRQAEIFNLKKNNVKMKDRYIEVTDTKTHNNRRVPINNTTHKILKKRLKEKDSEYIFRNEKGRKLTVLTNAFWKAVDEANLYKWKIDEKSEKERVRFRFHDLRHTFGSRLGMAAVDIKTIMEIMGHKTHKMAMRYQHPGASHKLNAVKILDEVPSKVTTRKVVNFKSQ